MKSASIAAISISIAFSLFTINVTSCNAATGEPSASATQGKGFAVLELFTSEGCSSCPPADALLARIQQQTDTLPVYVLAYHVDYWRRQGWQDTFSTPRNEERQYLYSQQLTGQVYTPQLIINGKASCVGSDEQAVQQGINDALHTAATHLLAVSASVQNGKLNFQYQITGTTASQQLLIAVVQKHAASQVKRGENAGRTLSHVAIVRDFETFAVRNNTGSGHLTLPAAFELQDGNLVGFLQNTETGEITAATTIVPTTNNIQ